jgi:hypothetical protein
MGVFGSMRLKICIGMPEEINAETGVKSGFLKDCISHETPDCIHRLGSLNVTYSA